MAVTYMTAEGLRKLKDDLIRLESVERPEISRQIAEARDKGDLSENAEYDAAKEAQGILEGKIAQLKNLIKTDEVQIMNKVTIRNLKTNKDMTYTLVSESEADLKIGKIAINSPIAQGLLGKKVGDKVDIQVPSGKVGFEVIDISV